MLDVAVPDVERRQPQETLNAVRTGRSSDIGTASTRQVGAAPSCRMGRPTSSRNTPRSTTGGRRAPAGAARRGQYTFVIGAKSPTSTVLAQATALEE
ncbi:hypothetical protein [Geodermatophilus sp. SYSU D01176]